MKNHVKKFVIGLVVLSVWPWIIAPAQTQSALFIRVNQLGFRPDDVKTAIAFGRGPLPADFRVVNATTGGVVFTGKPQPVNGTWGEFAHHDELDFTQLRQEGSYVIELGSTRSAEFSIDRNIDRDITDQLLPRTELIPATCICFRTRC